MTIVSSTAIRGLRKSRLCTTTAGIVMIACPCGFLAGRRVNILSAELSAAFPAPRATTARARFKTTTATCLKSACENIVTRGVFQTPTLAPGTLFGVCASTFLLWHSTLSYIYKENRLNNEFNLFSRWFKMVLRSRHNRV
jgi:hypothetical protein